jgi:hypothetical protein
VAHTFLSDEWLEAVAKIRAESGGDAGPDVTLNVTVTGGPEGDRDLHLEGGGFGPGHVEAPTKLSLTYEVARKMFVEGDQQAAMQAFMGGQIKIEGDMSKVMAMQGQSADPALLAKIQEVTA